MKNFVRDCWDSVVGFIIVCIVCIFGLLLAFLVAHGGC